jgi:hypothetical protein
MTASEHVREALHLRKLALAERAYYAQARDRGDRDGMLTSEVWERRFWRDAHAEIAMARLTLEAAPTGRRAAA